MGDPRINERKELLHEVIFESDTPNGKLFDVVLLIFILASVVVVMLETVPTVSYTYKQIFKVLEWVFTIFFTVEYALRLYCVYKPMKYAKSFFGVIDLLSILPTYLSIFIVGSQSLIIIRALRLLRVFRIFKMMSFLKHGKIITHALKASWEKIFVFLLFVLILVSILGSLMYLIESGPDSGFDSIPRSIYWAIVTLTTVGYGDISPSTNFGQFVAAFVMLLGYAVIAVPTGIITTELMNEMNVEESTQACRFCSKEGHDVDAIHCKYCGEMLNDPEMEEILHPH